MRFQEPHSHEYRARFPNLRIIYGSLWGACKLSYEPVMG